MKKSSVIRISEVVKKNSEIEISFRQVENKIS